MSARTARPLLFLGPSRPYNAGERSPQICSEIQRLSFEDGAVRGADDFKGAAAHPLMYSPHAW
jgi:hypothetical protein